MDLTLSISPLLCLVALAALAVWAYHLKRLHDATQAADLRERAQAELEVRKYVL